MASGTCGENLTWILDNKGTLTISGHGDMEDYEPTSLFNFTTAPWGEYYKSIKKVIIKNGVLSIGNYAFYACFYLTDVTIANSVTDIGDSAFASCVELTYIAIPHSVEVIHKGAFSHCKELTSFRLPIRLNYIYQDIFFDCKVLKEIHYFARGGFKYATLEKFLLEGNKARLIPYDITPPAQVKPTPQPVIKPAPQAAVEQLRWKVEGKTLTVGGVSVIKNYSYEETPWRDSLRDIQKIIIEEGVKKISANAFAECTRLEQLTIPVSVKTIGDGAFTFCYCGDRTINSGRNVIWSLEDGTLMIKKNPAAKNESNFSTGYETWQVVEGSITGVKIERGIVPANSFFDWVNRMGDGVSVTF